MRFRLATAALAVVALQVFAGGAASADDDPVLIGDSDDVTLTSQDDGGATATVTLQNQGPVPVTVGVALGAAAAPGCKVDVPDGATIAGHRQQAVELTFSAACDPDRDAGTDFTVRAGTASFDLHAEPPAAPDPNWVVVMLIYVVSALVSALVLAVAWLAWPQDLLRRVNSIRMPLPGLDADWKFSDSWAANATVVTALFAGLFGAKEVTTALLGDGADTLLAIALVSAAVSVGLVGLSPMLLQGLRVRSDGEDAKADGEARKLTGDLPAGLYVTPRGLLVAAFCTLTATAGQLSSLLYAVMDTDFGDDVLLAAVGAVGWIALVWYAFHATQQNLTTGAALPPPPEPAAGLGEEVANLGYTPSPATVVVVSAPAPAPRRPSGML